MSIYAEEESCMLFHGRTTWSVIMGEKHRLRGFQNSVLRKIFGPKMEEVTGDRRKVHNVEFNDVYSPRNIIRGIRPRTIWGRGGGGACDWYREWRDVYTLLLEKLQGKRRLGGPSRRWEDNIKLKAGGCGLD